MSFFPGFLMAAIGGGRGRLASVAAFVALTIALNPASASTTSARKGTVVTVQAGTQTSSQRDYSSYGDSYNNRRQDSRARSVIGGVLGGVVGAAVARNSGSYGRYTAAAGGASIGTAIGYTLDRRADASYERSQDTRMMGAQVIVRLEGGQTVAVFTRHLSGIYPGAVVWLIGDDQLIAAN